MIGPVFCRSLGGAHSDAVQHLDEMAACLRARPVAVHVLAACLDLETGWVLDAC